MMRVSPMVAAAGLVILVEGAAAFTAGGMISSLPSARPARSAAPALRMGHLETIEYIIRPDGRVEEKVSGVKGKQCHEVTKEVEEALGKVTYTQPTAEAFEEEVQVTTAETQTISTDGSTSTGGMTDKSSGGWSKY